MENQEKEMFALANQLDNVLSLEEENIPFHEKESKTAASGSSHKETQSMDQVKVLQLTLFFEDSIPSTSIQGANHLNNAHVILHLENVAATPESASSLEAVEIPLISDKFPDDQMGLQNLYNELSCKNSFFLIKCWADMDFGNNNGGQSIPYSTPTYHVTSRLESFENLRLTCTTRVCSFGISIGEKTDHLTTTQLDENQFIHENIRQPLCDYLVNFIEKLKTLDVATMNQVFENFSVLQVIKYRDTKESLMVLAYLFEACQPECEIGAAYKIYRLV